MATPVQNTAAASGSGTLNHKQPDRIPIDFGGTAVTGMHVSCVAELARLLRPGAAPRARSRAVPDAGADRRGPAGRRWGLMWWRTFPRNTMFGFPADEWKSWKFNGLEVLVARDFNASVDADGDTLIYPEWRHSFRPADACPSGGYFFDCIVRQEPLDEEKLNPEDNMEEFTLFRQRTSTTLFDGASCGSNGPRRDCQLRRHGIRRYRAGSGTISQASQGHPRRYRVVCFHQQPPGLHP